MVKPRMLMFCLGLMLAAAVFAQTPAPAAPDLGDDLRRAASEGDATRVKALLDAGADVNSKNKYGGTALAFACDRKRVEVVKLLLERGADPNVTDTFYNSTPLAWAAGKGNGDIVRLLLEHGAQGEENALIAAVYSDQPEVIKVMLDRGKVSAEGLSNALATAQSMQKAEIAALLKAGGAKDLPPANFQVDADTLKSYAGDYEGPNGMILTLAVQDGRLTAKFPGSGVMPLGALDAVTFRPDQFPGLKVVFNLTDGKVSGVSVDEGGGSVSTFKKKEVQQ